MLDFFKKVFEWISQFIGEKTRAITLLGAGGVSTAPLVVNMPDYLAMAGQGLGVVLVFVSVIHEGAKAYRVMWPIASEIHGEENRESEPKNEQEQE